MTDTRRQGVWDYKEGDGVESIIQSYVHSHQMTVRTHIPCEVISTDSQPLGFDPDKQLVSVKLGVCMVSRDPKNPDLTIKHKPIIEKNIPVGFLAAGNTKITFPISVGDTGILHVFDRDISYFLSKGKIDAPPTHFMHDPAYSLFVPNLHHQLNKLPSVDMTAMVLDSDQVKLGANAVQGVARLGDAVDQAPGFAAWFAQAQTILTTIAGVFNLPAPVPPNDFGLISEASTKVKAE